MDKLKATWKKAVNSRQKTFQGSGQKLGSGEGQETHDRKQLHRKPAPKPPPRAPPSEGKRLGFADQQTDFAPSQPQASGSAPKTWRGPPSGFTEEQNHDVVAESHGASSVPLSGDQRCPSRGRNDADMAREEVETALAVLRCEPRSGAAIALLSKVLTNILNSPTEKKFRRLRLENKRVMEDLVNVKGGVEFLQACEFELLFEDEIGYAVLPEEASLENAQFALEALKLCGAAEASQPLPCQQQPLQPAPAAAAAAAAAASTSSSSSSQHPATVSPSPCPAIASSAQQSAESPQAESMAEPLEIGNNNDRNNGNSSNTNGSNNSIGLFQGARVSGSSPSGSSCNDPTGPTAQQSMNTSRLNNAAPSSGAQPPLRVQRQTQVVLPAEPSAAVSEEVFRRTPAEVRTAYSAARKKMEQGQMLMTRESRARLASGSTARPKKRGPVAIRVRMPDGLILQGQFGPDEQVSEVFTWVTDALRDPSQTFDLISPSRKPLKSSDGSVTHADLAPSCLLTFRWLSRKPLSVGNELPTLSDASLTLICS